MEDKNILPRLSRKMLESSFFSFLLLLLSVVLLPSVFSDDVLLFVLVLAVAAIVEKKFGCEHKMVLEKLARSL